MKKQTIAALTIIALLTTAAYIDVSSAASQTQSTIQSSGLITTQGTTTAQGSTALKVILRALGNPMPNWTADIDHNVDMWVQNYTWIEGGAVVIEVGDIAQILWFNQTGWEGHSFNTTYGVLSNECPWTFAQLETLINRFHYWDISVVLGIIGFAEPGSVWSNSDIWGWMNDTQRELFFTHPDGSLYGVTDNSFSYPAPINWFATFPSYDPVSGATKGETLYNLFVTRLGQMIDAGLQWDGIFGSEGWGSVGVWGTGGTTSTWIDASENAVNQWANSSAIFHPEAFPASWATDTLAQKVNWIMNNADSAWQGYWDYCYATDLFENVHNMIESKRPSQFFIGDIFSPDSTWQDPNRVATWSGWSAGVGYNSTWLAEYCSGPTYLYYIDSESCYAGQLNQQAELGKLQAYVAASVKSSSPNFHTIIGMQLSQGSVENPVWIAEQEWLAQAQDYVWVNGTRYSAVDPTYCMIQYPDGSNGYLLGNWNELFTWIDSMLKVMDDVTPVYLGPTYFAGIRTWGPGSWDFINLNYTFAQWAFSDNYANNPNYFNPAMSTIYIPATWYFIQGGSLSGWQSTVLNNFAEGDLNVIFSIEDWGNCPPDMLGSVAFGSGASEAASMATFHLTNQFISSSDNDVVISNDVSDSTVSWITSGYSNQIYNISGMSGDYNGYKGTNGYSNISTFTSSGASNFGIYSNGTSGRFLYMCLTSTNGVFQTNIPEQMINKGIYWASDSPINSSQPMLDYKVFEGANGEILISMMNHENMGSPTDNGVPMTSTLSIDAAQLGLGNPSGYSIYWASNPSATLSTSSWSNLQITLNGMADVLVIQPV